LKVANQLQAMTTAVAAVVRAEKAAAANAAHATVTTNTAISETTREADNVLLRSILSIYDDASQEILTLMNLNSFQRLNLFHSPSSFPSFVLC
jgi:hypothetical protein